MTSVPWACNINIKLAFLLTALTTWSDVHLMIQKPHLSLLSSRAFTAMCFPLSSGWLRTTWDLLKFCSACWGVFEDRIIISLECLSFKGNLLSCGLSGELMSMSPLMRSKGKEIHVLYTHRPSSRYKAPQSLYTFPDFIWIWSDLCFDSSSVIL